MPKLLAAALFAGACVVSRSADFILDTQTLQVDAEAMLEAMRLDTSESSNEAGALSSAPGSKLTMDGNEDVEGSFDKYTFDDVGASNDPSDLYIESASKTAAAQDDGTPETQMVQLSAEVISDKGTKMKLDLEEQRMDKNTEKLSMEEAQFASQRQGTGRLGNSRYVDEIGEATLFEGSERVQLSGNKHVLDKSSVLIEDDMKHDDIKQSSNNDLLDEVGGLVIPDDP